MEKKPLENQQQEPARDSVLFRLWSRFKDKKPESDQAATSEGSQLSLQNSEQDLTQDTSDTAPGNEPTDNEPVNTEQEENSAQTPPPEGTDSQLPSDGEQQAELSDEGQQDPEEPEKPPVIDATLQLTISKDVMTATGVAFPPENGGAEISEDFIRQALLDKDVKEEFFSSGIKMLCTFKLYQKSAVLASGVAAKNGKDGYVEELFARESDIHLEADENDSVNYKNLNKLRIVKKGAVICKIIPPEPPVDGKNLHGEIIEGHPGKPMKIAVGKNMMISEDGTELIANCAGNLRFADEKFYIEDVLHIPGDVDNAVGNLEFCGDIVIDGGVREGFTVQSDKNITIKGTVEGAFINAKGSIALSKGMNGMGRGFLRAGEDVKCRFLENCTVNAGGSVRAESVMNCRITADNDILVEGGKGVIVGGTCTARNAIKAKSIGSPSYVATTIVLGVSPEVLAQKKQLTKQIDELNRQVNDLEKDCKYLEAAAKKAPLPTERASQLSQMKKQRMLSSVQISINTKQLLEIDELIESLESCKLSCSQIFPFVKIMMANESLQIKERESHKMYYYENGEIKSGSI